MWLGDAAQLHFYCSRMLFQVSIILIFIFDWLVRHSVFSVPYFTSGISLLGRLYSLLPNSPICHPLSEHFLEKHLTN